MESETQNPILFDPIEGSVTTILTGFYATQVSITQSTLLTEPDRRNRIWRCHLSAKDKLIPETVVIKQVSPEGYDPANPESWDTNRFFNDWAGARFLSTVAAAEGHGPAFYGGDSALGFIILEDMGNHSSLVEPLLEGNSTSASAALIAFAKRLGQMHASSIGKESLYREIQHNISPIWAGIANKSSEVLLQEQGQQIAAFMEICTRLGVTPAVAVQQEYEIALQRVAEPGSFRAFIHGDPCPDNLFYHAPDMRLIDFEFARFGHAFRDALYGRLPFPTCWCANTVPADVIDAMEQAYQAELANICPEVLDKQRFELEACAITAAWAIDSMQWHLDEALKQDHEWGIATTRSRILTRIEVFLATAHNANQMPELCNTYAKLLVELQQRWPETQSLPLYPAFRNGAVAA